MSFKLATGSSPVCIMGESGVGKLEFAKLIYKNSFREGQPFLVVHCGSIPDSLFLSELLGYERGAFTDAKYSHKGKLEQAGEGIIILDDVDCLSPTSQAALLQVLEEGKIYKLGASYTKEFKARLLCTTSCNLEDLVRRNKFRNDLWYRIYSIPIYISPLRERKEDIPLLADHFLESAAKTERRAKLSLSKNSLAALTAYDWPGNVRELKNEMIRLTVLAEDPGQIIEPSSLEARILLRSSYPKKDLSKPINYFLVDSQRKELVEKALSITNGNKSQAARLLGVSRRTIINYTKKNQ